MGSQGRGVSKPPISGGGGSSQDAPDGGEGHTHRGKRHRTKKTPTPTTSSRGYSPSSSSPSAPSSPSLGSMTNAELVDAGRAAEQKLNLETESFTTRLKKSRKTFHQIFTRFQAQILVEENLRAELDQGREALKKEKADREADKKDWARKETGFEHRLEETIKKAQEETVDKTRAEVLDEVREAMEQKQRQYNDLVASLPEKNLKAVEEWKASTDAVEWVLTCIEPIKKETAADFFFWGQLRARRLAHLLVPHGPDGFLDVLETSPEEFFQGEEILPKVMTAAQAIRA